MIVIIATKRKRLRAIRWDASIGKSWETDTWKQFDNKIKKLAATGNATYLYTVFESPLLMHDSWFHK